MTQHVTARRWVISMGILCQMVGGYYHIIPIQWFRGCDRELVRWNIYSLTGVARPTRLEALLYLRHLIVQLQQEKIQRTITRLIANKTHQSIRSKHGIR